MYNGNISRSSENSRFSETDSNSKAYVAGILSNMSNRESGYPAVSVAYMPGYLTSVANSSMSNGTSLTLTPTTLSNIEQTFIELQSVPVSSSGQNPVTQSGFVPPVVRPSSANGQLADASSYYSDEMSSDADWEPSEKCSRDENGKSLTSVYHVSSSTPGRKRRGRYDDEGLSAEDEAKRRVRRERNKIAAAKCRQRRVDHTNRLVNETEKLEEEKGNLESEIQQLQQQKDQLEFILQAHQPLCMVDGKPRNCTDSTSSTVRPNSLPLNLKKEKKEDDSNGCGSLVTPTALFSLGFDSFIGSTGLTPVSTGLTPYLTSTGLTPITSGPCSSEAQRCSSDSSDAIGSPSRLVSL